MSLIILHDLDGEEVAVNTDTIVAAKRRFPDRTSAAKEPFTKLFYTSRDKTMESLGFPDTVRETPKEICAIAAGKGKPKGKVGPRRKPAKKPGRK